MQRVIVKELRMSKNQKKVNRRKFFDYIAKSAVGFALLNALPFNILAEGKHEKPNSKNLKSVNLHPQAVKRKYRVK